MDDLVQPIANRALNLEETLQAVVDMSNSIILPFINGQLWNTVDVWPIPAEPQHIRLNGRQVEVRLAMGGNGRPEMQFPAHNHRYMFEVQTTPGAPDIWLPYRVLYASPRRQLRNDQNAPLALQPNDDGRVVLGLIDTQSALMYRTELADAVNRAEAGREYCAAGVQECQQLAELNANYDEGVHAWAVDTMPVFAAPIAQMDGIIEELETLTESLDTAAVVNVPPATPPPSPPPAGVPAFPHLPGQPPLYFDEEPPPIVMGVAHDPNAVFPDELLLPAEQPQPNPLPAQVGFAILNNIRLNAQLNPGGGPPRHPPPGGYPRFP